jgi:peptidoglycan/LPS O-acetylase OafA/YrhL
MNKRNPNLDLLRFLAANFVVLQHLVYIEWGGVGHLGKLRPFGDLGYLGVDVFFAISGYVISLSASGKTPQVFLAARFIRIFPGLIFAGILSSICVQSSYAPIHTSIFGDISSIFLLNSPTGTQFSNPVFWTLAYEFKFYIIISILLLLKKNSLLDLRIASMIWLFVAFILGPNPDGVLGAIFMPNYAPCFILGIILSSLKSKRELIQFTPVLVVSIILAINTRIQEWKTFPLYRQQWHSATLTSLTLFLLLMVFVVTTRVQFRSKKYEGIAYRLGMYSYPIYLLHFTPMLTLVSALYFKTHHAIASVIFSYIFMLATAIIFAEIFEPKLKNFLRKKMV